jgi:hypothetical protein
LNIGNAPRSFASSADAVYAWSRMFSEMRAAMVRASPVSYFRPQHDERVAQAGEAEADAALRHRFSCCCLSGQAVMSSTLSSMRIAGRDRLAELAKSNEGFLGRTDCGRTSSNQSKPRQQQP